MADNPPVQRRLAAILAADVAGYSRLMGADEEGTLARLKTLRAGLIDPAIARHNGRIVKTTGDGLLVAFASVVDAMRCATEWQDAMVERAETGIAWRIGVNLGDIIIDDGDIHGDGVNIAARLEGMAEPSGICISHAVLTQTRGKLNFPVEDLGEQALRNIAQPVHVFRVLAEEKKMPEPAALPLPDKPSIAVLPFQNMSGDSEQEYFADGMVEEIITALSRIRWLFVIARNSSFTYKGQAVDVKQVGRELGVRYLLEGSVRKGGNRVRITGQLIEAETGTHLWADRFDGSLEDVFELQDKIATSVAGVIEPALQAAEMRRSAARPTTDLTAYDLYLRALAVFFPLTKERLIEARGLLARAIAIDPRYGPAISWAAICLMQLVNNGWAEQRDVNRREAIDLARQALDATQNDPGVLANAAFVLANFGEDIAAMSGLVDRALALTPSFARGWYLSGFVRTFAGEHDLAIEHFETALRLSPRERLGSPLSAMALPYFFKRRFDEAASKLALSIQDFPGFPIPYRTLAACYAHMGRLDDAQAVIARLSAITPQIVPSELPWHRPEDRELFLSGLRLAIGEAGT
ncbi:MAG TPA: tetratricopeptide repeat protein [Stellaceae bacterium]|nr:tetratricopeptide repeat protein [Stellaceae bacterium]